MPKSWEVNDIKISNLGKIIICEIGTISKVSLTFDNLKQASKVIGIDERMINNIANYKNILLAAFFLAAFFSAFFFRIKKKQLKKKPKKSRKNLKYTILIFIITSY